jgi:hypothetical protein
MNITVFINILYTLSDIFFYFSSPAASHFLRVVQNNLIKLLAVATTKVKELLIIPRHHLTLQHLA